MEAEYKFKIPEIADIGRSRETAIGALWDNLRSLESNKEENMYDFQERTACGYPVPLIQRRVVWTNEQCIRFIESAYLGLPLGTYTVHASDWNDNGKSGVNVVPCSGWLLDGQQRLTAIEKYWNDEFKVFGAYWSELTPRDQRRFRGIKFTSFETPLWDLEKVKDLYYLLAYGGTPHDESQYD